MAPMTTATDPSESPRGAMTTESAVITAKRNHQCRASAVLPGREPRGPGAARSA